MDGISRPTYLPTLATLDNRSCISDDCNDKLCGRITVRRSGLQARRAPRITAMLVPDDPPISYDDDDDVDDDDDRCSTVQYSIAGHQQ